MKTLVVLVLLSIVATAVAAKRDKRWFFPKPKCSEDADCGSHGCCIRRFGIPFCKNRPGVNDSCNVSHRLGCDCREGLSCQIWKQWGILKYRRCFPEPGSGDGFY